MTLHVFNPEHDLALASGLSNFTAPHAGRRLRADLGYLPALWAGVNDCVLVEHVEQARRVYGRLRARVGGSPCRFVDKSQLRNLPIDRVEPWGWDMALRARRRLPTSVSTPTAVMPQRCCGCWTGILLPKFLRSRRWSNVCPILRAWWSRHPGAVVAEGCVSLAANSQTTNVVGSVTSSLNRDL